MSMKNLSRRTFVGGATAAATLGAMGFTPEVIAAKERRAAERGIRRLPGGAPMLREWQSQVDAYDALAHLSSNENPYPPLPGVVAAATAAVERMGDALCDV